MNYYSTNKKSSPADFREATINGQAPDRGLYFPDAIPAVDQELIKNIESYSNEEIAFRVIKPFVSASIPDATLMEIVKETVNFPLPLKRIDERIFSLELFHGP